MADSKPVVNLSVPLALCLVGMLAAACSPAADGPPEIVVDHSTCAHCGMLISEPRYAAAFRIDGRDSVFDDVGCLLQSLQDESASAAAEVWFRDVDDGSWLTADEAVFVHAAGLPTPMAGGIVATKSREDADELAARRAGEVLATFEALKNDFARRAAASGREGESDR